MDRSGIAYWDRLSTYWSVPPPLSPSAQDLTWFGDRIAERQGRPARAALLGTTASLATLSWPSGATLLALDWSTGMLRHVPAGQRMRAAGDWRQMPLASRALDVFFGDGCYSALGSAEDARLFTLEMHRVLRPGGEVWMRCFVQPQIPEPAHAVLAELATAARVEPHAFRWRLAMAVHGPHRFGFALDEVWQAWSSVPDRHTVARRLDWQQAEVDRFERWRGETARYAFPTLERLREIVAPRFHVVRIDLPSHAFGECFPRLQLRARG